MANLYEGQQRLDQTFDLSLASNRFRAARREIERQPCQKPLNTICWVTAETLPLDIYKRWRDMGNGVFYLVGE